MIVKMITTTDLKLSRLSSSDSFVLIAGTLCVVLAVSALYFDCTREGMSSTHLAVVMGLCFVVKISSIVVFLFLHRCGKFSSFGLYFFRGAFLGAGLVAFFTAYAEGLVDFLRRNWLQEISDHSVFWEVLTAVLHTRVVCVVAVVGSSFKGVSGNLSAEIPPSLFPRVAAVVALGLEFTSDVFPMYELARKFQLLEISRKLFPINSLVCALGARLFVYLVPDLDHASFAQWLKALLVPLLLHGVYAGVCASVDSAGLRLVMSGLFASLLLALVLLLCGETPAAKPDLDQLV